MVQKHLGKNVWRFGECLEQIFGEKYRVVISDAKLQINVWIFVEE